MVKEILDRISKRIEKLEQDTKSAEVLIRLGKEMGLDLDTEEMELEKAKDELAKWKEAIEKVKSEL
ncbi:MAG: hypothetical protein DRJ64_02145 [Thermoprotei archaeon]|nr:MAG: hypothetical protein DRJ64_02145 [Thermoprotei archaeon]